MFALSVFKRALLHFLFIDTLITEHGVDRRNGHNLHRERNHHEDYEDAANWESLRQSFSPLDFVDLVGEEINTDLDEAEENTNDAVERHEHEKSDVEVHFNIDKVVMLWRETSQKIV